MFYSHTFLAKKTPLGTVWIAAHLERKIKKPQIDGINISSYAECIITPEVPIALRLSGHLLLGLVRIYSWKVNYLAQDCRRVLTDVKSVFPSTQVNLPAEADRAPFESVTLPETFQLDAVELDDSIYQSEIPDNHCKDYDQITITDEFSYGGDKYVAVFISQDSRTESASQTQMSNPGSGPMEEDVLPPFEGGLDALAAEVLNTVDSRDPDHQVDGSIQNIAENHSAQEVPEIEVMREAVHDFEAGNISHWSDFSKDIDGESASATKRKDSLSPIVEGVLASGMDSLPLRSHAKEPTTASADIPNIHNTGISFGDPLPVLELQPSPVAQDHKVKKRKRRQLYDQTIVLNNVAMKRQIYDSSRLHRKRRKLPCSSLDLWRCCRKRQQEQILYESLLCGMCNDLRGTFQRSFSQPSVDSFPSEASLRSSPGTIPDIIMEPEQPRFDEHVEVPMTEILPSPSAGEEFTPFKPDNVGLLFDSGKTLQRDVLPTPESSATAEPVSRQPEAPLSPWEEEPSLGDINTPSFPSLLNSSDVEDFEFLEASNASSGHEPNQVGDMSARTRAVAQYFIEHSPPDNSPENQFRIISLDKILEGRTRKQCARMFFETLVLKSHGLIDVQQDEAYGDIQISPMPALSTDKI